MHLGILFIAIDQLKFGFDTLMYWRNLAYHYAIRARVRAAHKYYYVFAL